MRLCRRPTAPARAPAPVPALPRARSAERFLPRSLPQTPDRPDQGGGADARTVRVDFGDGECVAVSLARQRDFARMLLSVGAAGVRRKAANGFPTYDAPLVHRLEDVEEAWEYMVWPSKRPAR